MGEKSKNELEVGDNLGCLLLVIVILLFIISVRSCS